MMEKENEKIWRILFNNLYIRRFFNSNLYSIINVSSKNEETISMLLSQVTEIKEENKLKRIGYMQGLGEWILYLDYKDGTKDEIVLKDHEAHDLYMYIKQNGSIAGTKGKVAKYTLILSISVIIIDKVLLIINKNRKKY